MTAHLRLGMIGAGWIADRHLESVANLDGVSVAAVTDLDRDRADRVAERSGAVVHEDWRSMLEGGEVDAVLVLTPPLHHREPALAAIASGLPVYLEKPVARTAEDARAIAGAVTDARAIVAVGYQYRALDFLGDLAAAAAEDPPGLLHSYSVGATAGRPWFVNQAQGGGQVLERASHHIDLQRAIAGDVDWVQAAGSKVPLAGDQRPVGADIDDVVVLTLGFRSGAVGTVLVAWTQPGLPSRYTLDVVSAGTALHVELDPAFSVTGVRGGSDVSLYVDAPPIQRGLERFLDAVRAGDPRLVACDVESAAGTLGVALACEQALAGGGRVPVAA
jgi:myo-inositol 2-dehydrogenase / D-chiro-inositol 1-dehydrogenase